MTPLVSTVLVAAAALLVQQHDIGPAPGRLVDIGGRRMHLHCTGAGSPTVVLEAGASAFAMDWSLVQPIVARTNRVCSYDRAGSGWSDAASEVETAARVVRDLRATLAAARERPPYVLVGASRGGIFVRVYHLDHAEEVAGLVLVDPASEDRLFTMFRGSAVPIASLSAGEHRSILPESGSFPIPRRRPQTGAPFDRLPPELYAVRVALDQRLIDSFPPAVSASVVREFREGDHAALSRLLASREQGRLKTVPLVVLTRDNGPADLSAAHAALARLSGNGRHTVVAGAGHEIHLFAPDVVVQAIRDVVMAATTGPQAPTDR